MTRFTFLSGPSGSASWPSRPTRSPSFRCQRSSNRSKSWRDVVCSSPVVPVVATAALLVAAISHGVARAAGAWVAPASEKTRPDPLPGDARTLDLGEKVAKVNCVPCHGSHFKGDGPAATTLNPRPADWTSKRVQDQTDGELFWKISAGRGAMPSWKHLSEKERWAVVRFIKSLRAGAGPT